MFHFQDNCFQSGFISTPEPVAQSTDTWRRKGIRTQVPQFFKITSLTLDFHELLLDSGSALLRCYPIISPLHWESTWTKDEVTQQELSRSWSSLRCVGNPGVELWIMYISVWNCKWSSYYLLTGNSWELSLTYVRPLNCSLHSTGISKRGNLIPSV